MDRATEETAAAAAETAGAAAAAENDNPLASREAYRKWRRSWFGQRLIKQARKPSRWNAEHGRRQRRLDERNAREADARAKRQQLIGDGCPHILVQWDVVPHARYPDVPALAHRVPVGVACRGSRPAGPIRQLDHMRAGHGW